jgi:hypothetical protein
MSNASLEPFGPRKHGNEVTKKAKRGQARQPEIECHRLFPSGPVAQSGVAQACRDKGEEEADPEDVLHEYAPA